MSHLQLPSISHWSDPSTLETFSVGCYLVRIPVTKKSCLCRLTESRSGDLHILCSRVLHLPSFHGLPQKPTILHSLWCGSARTCCHPGRLKWPVERIHVDRPPQLPRRPTRVLCSITGRVVRHHRIGLHRHGKYLRRWASRASHLALNGNLNRRTDTMG